MQERSTLDRLEAFLGTRDPAEMTRKLDELQALIDEAKRQIEEKEQAIAKAPPAGQNEP